MGFKIYKKENWLKNDFSQRNARFNNTNTIKKSNIVLETFKFKAPAKFKI